MPIEYSVWLMPEKESKAYTILDSVIKGLAKIDNSTPFEPHVTLIGCLNGDSKDLINKTQTLASRVSPPMMKMQNPDSLRNYDYNCLFSRIKITPELRMANLLCQEIFSSRTKRAYEPHLSLAYGYFPPKTRKEIVSNLNGCLNLEFITRTLCLYITGDNVESWQRIIEFPL